MTSWVFRMKMGVSFSCLRLHQGRVEKGLNKEYKLAGCVIGQSYEKYGKVAKSKKTKEK
jgi:hypothetical protein